jgi:hypothetical protein
MARPEGNRADLWGLGLGVFGVLGLLPVFGSAGLWESLRPLEFTYFGESWGVLDP